VRRKKSTTQTSAGCDTLDDVTAWTAVGLHTEILHRNRINILCWKHHLNHRYNKHTR